MAAKLVVEVGEQGRAGRLVDDRRCRRIDDEPVRIAGEAHRATVGKIELARLEVAILEAEIDVVTDGKASVNLFRDKQPPNGAASSSITALRRQSRKKWT